VSLDSLIHAMLSCAVLPLRRDRVFAGAVQASSTRVRSHSVSSLHSMVSHLSHRSFPCHLASGDPHVEVRPNPGNVGVRPGTSGLTASIPARVQSVLSESPARCVDSGHAKGGCTQLPNL